MSGALLQVDLKVLSFSVLFGPFFSQARGPAGTPLGFLPKCKECSTFPIHVWQTKPLDTEKVNNWPKVTSLLVPRQDLTLNSSWVTFSFYYIALGNRMVRKKWEIALPLASGSFTLPLWSQLSFWPSWSATTFRKHSVVTSGHSISFLWNPKCVLAAPQP